MAQTPHGPFHGITFDLKDLLLVDYLQLFLLKQSMKQKGCLPLNLEREARHRLTSETIFFSFLLPALGLKDLLLVN